MIMEKFNSGLGITYKAMDKLDAEKALTETLVNYLSLKEGASGSPAEGSCFTEATCPGVSPGVAAVSPQA